MSAEEPDVAAPLDQLLTQATKNPMQRLVPGASGIRFLGALAGRPGRVATRVGELAQELGRVAAGTSEVAAGRTDRRFADPAWSENPLLRRIMQGYLATSSMAEGLVQDVPMEWEDAQRMKFVVNNLVQAASPSNNPLISPVAWKSFIDSGGANAVRGPRNLIRDMASAPRVPAMVPSGAYTVGEDLGVTPGSVVMRTEMLEVIQYTPQTDKVREVPLLIIPPTINKFYVLDLAPGRSLIEYLVQQGHQVFVVSWRNPDARHSKWGFDAYAEAIIEAFNTVDQIAGAKKVHAVAACSGGILACLTAGHRAAKGQLDRLASLSLLVTMLDQKKAGMTSAMIDERVAEAAIARSRRKGYLDGRNLAEVFAWLRPQDLVWNYWVNNYVQGKSPRKFDILYWNADTTRMTARLHRDFVDAAVNDKLIKPNAVEVLGTPVDLAQIKVDSYVVAGSADHICPWTNCYRSSQLLGGDVRFVLSTNGHIAALVNPPSNKKSSYRVSDDISGDSDAWLDEVDAVEGSWWPDYAAWLGARSGKRIPAPTALGNAEFPPLESAPGAYVLDK